MNHEAFWYSCGENAQQLRGSVTRGPNEIRRRPSDEQGAWSCVGADLSCGPSTCKLRTTDYARTSGLTSSRNRLGALIAPTAEVKPGALAGDYAGATGGASVGVGAGANVLVGGSNKTISLQPVSVEGSTGLNVAGGRGALSLSPAQ